MIRSPGGDVINSMKPDLKDLRPTVFFDGGCPLCSREIAHYRRLDTVQHVHWVDITREPQALERVGLDGGAAMARFHLLDRCGVWQTGAWGFVAMWAELPGYRWLARFVTATRTTALLDVPYRWFARRRLRQRCDDNCSLPPETRQ